MRARETVLAMVIVGAVGGVATAQGFVEVDDAPEFPNGCGQPVTGSGLVHTIAGSTSTSDDDYVDTFLIDIVDPLQFYATTSSAIDSAAAATWNTRLFLFDSDGTPMLANDNAPNAPNGQSHIGSPGMYVGPMGPTVGSLRPGRYVLAVSGWANDPIDAPGTPLFDLASLSNGLVGPNPASDVFDRWENFHAGVQSGDYVIAVNGVAFITEVTEPCPADVNCDLVVDVDDLTAVIIHWGGKGGPADVDRDGLVEIDDLVMVLLAWGPCH